MCREKEETRRAGQRLPPSSRPAINHVGVGAVGFGTAGSFAAEPSEDGAGAGLPLTFAFCFLPSVCRAVRVALFLAMAVALVSTVFFVLLRGESPKSASVAGS